MASQPPERPDPRTAFSELFQEHGRAIYAHVRTFVPNDADADDVFQETSRTLWAKFDQYQAGTDFRAWACRFAYYKALQLRGRKFRSPRLFSPEVLDVLGEEMMVMSDTLDRRSEALALCRQKLNQRDSDLLARYYREGTTAKQVAAHLSRSVDFVYRMVRRIHNLLFECIQNTLKEENNP